MPKTDDKQNITVRLSRETIRKARILAARRSTSLSGLLTSQIEGLAGVEDEYHQAMHDSISLMRDGFNSETTNYTFDRESLHER